MSWWQFVLFLVGCLVTLWGVWNLDSEKERCDKVRKLNIKITIPLELLEMEKEEKTEKKAS